MMNDAKFYQMIHLHSGVDVWPDFVPEDATLPAISYVQISDKFNRVLEGSKSAKSDTWRLSLVCNDLEELEQLVNLVETIDNTVKDGYQRIFVIYRKRVPRTSDEQITFTYLIDLETYGD